MEICSRRIANVTGIDLIDTTIHQDDPAALPRNRECSRSAGATLAISRKIKTQPQSIFYFFCQNIRRLRVRLSRDSESPRLRAQIAASHESRIDHVFTTIINLIANTQLPLVYWNLGVWDTMDSYDVRRRRRVRNGSHRSLAQSLVILATS